MGQNRSDRQSSVTSRLPILTEVLRQSTESSKEKDDGKDEHQIPVFWRVLGGTVLSITSLIVMTAYQSLSGGIADLRTDLVHLDTEMRKEFGRMGESQGELVPKEAFESRVQMIWTSVRELQGDRKELTALKERCQGLAGTLKSGEEQRRQIAGDVQTLREQQAAGEERRALVKELSDLRERLAGLEARKSSGSPSAGHAEEE